MGSEAAEVIFVLIVIIYRRIFKPDVEILYILRALLTLSDLPGYEAERVWRETVMPPNVERRAKHPEDGALSFLIISYVFSPSHIT